ncbi:hypothetical protein GGS23DRAFT_362890 [Durotheca rogersii]|uniref:uncharacterized protein n=1 Tax=Durotheca rogersii TaxID=419775 RepID=UPI00221FD0AD|nr:uncharacterized protein GGS23DRAFT_362890 [Durotheca rogersii]KAI5865971.1 hypothetical protein GGS23DRAFT_362890 [Durotheca rogersii]
MADEDPGLGRSEAAKWFSSDIPGAEGPNGWRLDVVTLLAVIGESSIAEHAQTITASIFCLLPRIIPAPQAFLKPSRPVRLPETTAKLTGVYSGVVLDTVGFFANIIHPLDSVQPYGFQVLRISHTDRNSAGGVEVRGPHRSVTANLITHMRFNGRTVTSPGRTLPTSQPGGSPQGNLNGAAAGAAGTSSGFHSAAEVEAGSAPSPGITRRITVKMQDFVANPTLANTKGRPAIPATLYSPVHVLSVFSALVTGGIIALAAHYQDGTAILAVSLVSLASSVVGWASWWKPLLMIRSHTNKVPAGDVIIRTREGAFLLVKCTEDVARELYSGTEECEYHVSGNAYRVLMGAGTCLLMVSVILLGNCKWNIQIFVGAAYIVLNGLYWAMGLLPKRLFWDLDRYRIDDITPKQSLKADRKTSEDPREGVASFTRTLWYAVRETGRTAWVHRSGAAPDTPQWRMWLAEAEEAAKDEHAKWNWKAVERKDAIMKLTDREVEERTAAGRQPARNFDEAEQAAPAVEVQAHNREYGGGTL